MKLVSYSTVYKTAFCFFLFVFANNVFSQNTNSNSSDFWKNVSVGGGFGLGVGNGFTNISIVPSAVYNFNNYFSAGIGLQGSYVKQKNVFNSYIYGASLISLINPINEMQLSFELEQLRVNQTNLGSRNKDTFWNTALFVGAGYRNENVTFGIRYNVLHKDNNFIYTQAWMPFVRVYF